MGISYTRNFSFTKGRPGLPRVSDANWDLVDEELANAQAHPFVPNQPRPPIVAQSGGNAAVEQRQMPSAPSKQCTSCSKVAMLGSRWCTDHQVANNELDNRRTSDVERRKNDPLRSLYSEARWRHTRATILYRDPLCVCHGNHASVIVDHVVPAHRWVAEHHCDIESFYDIDNLQGMCKIGHDAKTR